MSGRTRSNIRKRGSTYTYYVYVTGPDGKRSQVTKGGFRTRRDAETAQIEVLNAKNKGTFVRPEHITLGDFLVEEWLPSRRPPNLEESTHASYERYIRLHVNPYLGAVPLQRLTPMDLNGRTEHCSTRAGASRSRRANSTQPNSSAARKSCAAPDCRTRRSPSN